MYQKKLSAAFLRAHFFKGDVNHEQKTDHMGF